MGSHSSFLKRLNHVVQEFNEEQWELKVSSFQQSQNRLSFLSSKVQDSQRQQYYYSQKNQKMVEKNSLVFKDGKQADQFVKNVEWRNSCSGLLDVKYFKASSASACLCGQMPVIQIFTQVMSNNLSKLVDIPSQDYLYLLQSIFQTYSYVIKKFPKVDFAEKNVFITEDYKIKIWINSDVSSFQPQKVFDEDIRNPEECLVKNIMQKVSKRQLLHYQKQSFQSFINQRYESIETILLGVKKYAEKYNIAISSSLEYSAKRKTFSTLHYSISDQRYIQNPENACLSCPESQNKKLFSCQQSSIVKMKSNDSIPQLPPLQNAFSEIQNQYLNKRLSVQKLRIAYKLQKQQIEDQHLMRKLMKSQEESVVNQDQLNERSSFEINPQERSKIVISKIEKYRQQLLKLQKLL